MKAVLPVRAVRSVKALVPLLLLLATATQAAEHQVHGLLDLRYSRTDGIAGYLDGDYGKLRYDNGGQWSQAQGALVYSGEFAYNLSLHVIGNSYSDGVRDGAGLTEAYLQYRGLPSQTGLRLEARAGLLYPTVSMENVLTAWASPYTLDYATINSWIGEEVRHQGVEVSVTRLGKFSDSDHDFTLGAALFRGNDPTGAMLAWHGWVLGSRQTLQQETLPLPDIGEWFVPEVSEPFLELDERIGAHLTLQWQWHNRGRVLGGHYDNHGDPRVAENLQWAWRTRFSHLGIKWQLPAQTELIAQYLQGDTLMQSAYTEEDLVKNDYHSAYLMLSKQFQRHRLTARVEEFAVVDNDAITTDNNDEYGKASTLSYGYRFDHHWFAQAEYSWLRSDRPSRGMHGHRPTMTEQQWQLAVRCFF